jgi:hypothetical protein
MKQDPGICKALLKALNRVGPTGIEESAALERTEAEYGSPLTTQAARDTLLFCADRGWCASRVDDFELTRWWITEAGKTRLAGM